ncbi:HIT family protein [Candidatus Woesearchaeota archaeon]|nr:HIT family protein [Candidatus Woesearchaeota archaeon]
MTCVVCDKIKEKKALIVFEDDNLIAILPAKPSAPGHVKIMPKQHFTKLEELSDDVVEELFFLANFASSAVFETVKAHGTNIIMNESENHLSLDVIPRKEGDGMNFLWKPKKLNQFDMDEAHAKIKDKAFVVGKTEMKEESKPIASPGLTMPPGASVTPATPTAPSEKKEDDKVIKIPKEDKINYMTKQLTKIP